MKKLNLKGIISVLAILLFTLSCTDDSNISKGNIENKNTDNISNRINSLNEKIVFENVEIVLGDSINKKYVDGKLDYTYTSTKEIDFETEIQDNNLFIYNNLNHDEFYKLENAEVFEDYILFDFVKNDGTRFNDIKYYANETILSEARVCVWCPIIVTLVTVIVDGIVQGTTESDCSAAIKACQRAGGLPSTIISEGIFSYSCTVNCVKK